MAIGRNFLLGKSLLFAIGLLHCTPSKTEVTLSVDKGYSIPPDLPQFPELVQYIYGECKEKKCAFEFPKESFYVSYRPYEDKGEGICYPMPEDGLECRALRSEFIKTAKKSFTVILQDEEGDRGILMADDPPFGSVDSVYFADFSISELVVADLEKDPQLQKLYEESILVSLTTNGEKGVITPSQLHNTQRQLLLRYLGTPNQE